MTGWVGRKLTGTRREERKLKGLAEWAPCVLFSFEELRIAQCRV